MTTIPTPQTFYQWRELLHDNDGEVYLGTSFDPRVDEFDPCEMIFDTESDAIAWAEDFFDMNVPANYMLTIIDERLASNSDRSL